MILISQEDLSSLSKLHEQIYLRDQATAYLPGLHISRATDIKMVADKVSSCLLVWGSAKKKGLKLYYNKEMPSRKRKVEKDNFPRSWSSLFSWKKLVHIPDAYDARTFWNQTVWMDSQKAYTFGYDGSDNVEHRDVVQG